MKTQSVLVLVILMNLNLNAQTKIDSLNADKIINNCIASMGGIEYLKGIKTLYSETKTEMEGREVIWIVKQVFPNKGSFQIEYKGRVIFENWFNGKKGFEIKNGEKKKADKDEFKNKLYKKNIFEELDYLDSTLWRLEYLGIDILEKDSCYKVKATLVNGSIKLLYFDKNNFQIIRSDKIENSEKGRFKTFLYSNFKTTDKLTYPTEVKFGENGIYKNGTIIKLLINQSVDENDFK